MTRELLFTLSVMADAIVADIQDNQTVAGYVTRQAGLLDPLPEPLDKDGDPVSLSNMAYDYVRYMYAKTNSGTPKPDWIPK